MKVRHFVGFGFKRLAVLSVVLQLLACSLDSGEGEGAGAGAGLGAAIVSWNAPSEREDGEGLSMAEIGGYRIYFGTTEGDYPNKIIIDDGNIMEGKVIAPPGVYFVVVTVYDTYGSESDYSSPVLKIQV